MATQFQSISIPAAAAELGVEPADLSRAIVEAAEEAERPSGRMCTSPGPMLEMNLVVGRRMIIAMREDAASDAWRVRIP